MNNVREFFSIARIRLIAGGLALLVIGGVLGAVFASHGSALAAADNTGRTAVTATDNSKYCQLYERTLENTLNISEQQLKDANTAALKAAVQQAVTDGKLTQAKADALLAKVNTAVSGDVCSRLGSKLNGGKGLGFGGGKIGQGLKQGQAAIVAAVATKLGLTTDVLTADIQSGKTITDIATAQKVSTADLNTTILTTVKSELDKAVAAATLTQANADKALQMITTAVNAGHYGLVGLGKGPMK